jgi:signal peptide peptidase SppA
MTMTTDDKNTTTAQPEGKAPAAWLAEMEAHVWAMHPQVLSTLLMLARAGTPIEPALTEAASSTEAARRGRPPSIKGSIAKVDLKGVLMPGGGSILGMLFGFPSPLESFKEGFAAAMADPNVGHVIIDVDSPGGVTDGIPEAAAMMRDLRAQTGKGVTAFVNTLAASAAYWLASQADEIVTTPSGMTGSIGVYATHRDLSQMQADLGVKTTLIKAGKYKVEGNPFEPLSPEALDHIQADVNYFYDLFTADVAQGRGVDQQAVIDGYGEGRVLPARTAQQAKLVDRIETLGETVARLSARAKPALGTPAAHAEDTTVATDAEADAGAEELTHAGALARLEGLALLQDRTMDKLQPAS